MKANLSIIVVLVIILNTIAPARAAVWQHPVSRKSGRNESVFSVEVRRTIAEMTRKEYCRCSATMCKCCRQLAPPMYVPHSGLGCARFKYVDDQTMLVTLKFNDAVVWSKKVSSECVSK